MNKDIFRERQSLIIRNFDNTNALIDFTSTLNLGTSNKFLRAFIFYENVRNI